MHWLRLSNASLFSVPAISPKWLVPWKSTHSAPKTPSQWSCYWSKLSFVQMTVGICQYSQYGTHLAVQLKHVHWWHFQREQLLVYAVHFEEKSWTLWLHQTCFYDVKRVLRNSAWIHAKRFLGLFGSSRRHVDLQPPVVLAAAVCASHICPGVSPQHSVRCAFSTLSWM